MPVATFEFDEREYYRALRLAARFNPGRWALVVMGAALPAYMVWAEVLSRLDRMTTSQAFLNALPWILLALFYLMLLPGMYRSMARKALENDPSLRGAQIRTIDESGVRIQGAGFSQDLRWEDILRVVDSPEFFLFFYNKRMAYYAPKRAFNSETIADVQRLTRAHAGDRLATV